MSDTKSTPKKGTVAAANLRIDAGLQRIAVLEATIRKLKLDTTAFELAQQPDLRKNQFTARVTRPGVGLALPIGYEHHSYISIRLKDELIDGQIVSPSEYEVMALLLMEAHEQFPGFVSVELADVSPLPMGW